MTSELVVADIGGTNARFTRAKMSHNGSISLGEPVILPTSDFPDLPSAWRAFLKTQPGFEPQEAAFALAGPVSDAAPFKLTNNDWAFNPGTLANELGLEQVTLLNDFAAIAHGVAGDLGSDQASKYLEHLAGPQQPLPQEGTVTVIGPGTGLGVAYYRRHQGIALIQSTEGSHIDFAPVNDVDDVILALLRQKHNRVSIERVISGEGIAAIYTAISEIENVGTAKGADTPETLDPLTIWRSGLASKDPIAVRAIAHFTSTLGRAVGDYVLAHGSAGVAIAGGVGLRLRKQLAEPVFHRAFLDKGRYRTMMEAVPIKLVTHPQPGLLGAALAHRQNQMED